MWSLASQDNLIIAGCGNGRIEVSIELRNKQTCKTRCKALGTPGWPESNRKPSETVDRSLHRHKHCNREMLFLVLLSLVST